MNRMTFLVLCAGQRGPTRRTVAKNDLIMQFGQAWAKTMYRYRGSYLHSGKWSKVTANRAASWGRFLSIINTGRRPRSMDEQLKKIKDPEAKAEGSSAAAHSTEPYDPQNPSSKPTVKVCQLFGKSCVVTQWLADGARNHDSCPKAIAGLH